MSTTEQQKSYHMVQQLIQNLASQTGDLITNPPETALFVITGYRKTNGQTISAYTKGADDSQVFIDMFTAACEQSPDLAYVLGIAMAKSNHIAKEAFNQGAQGGEPY